VAALIRFDYDAMSKVCLSRAVTLLSIGRLVITDRLNAHILCLLHGIPHILLNNATGENWSFYETWTRGGPQYRLETHPTTAWALARSTIDAPPNRQAAIKGWDQASEVIQPERYRWRPVLTDGQPSLATKASTAEP
jgi:hypothetical protein